MVGTASDTCRRPRSAGPGVPSSWRRARSHPPPRFRLSANSLVATSDRPGPSAAPVSAFTLWKVDAVKVLAGAEHLGSYSKTPNSIRKWCKLCGGHVMTEHPSMKLIDVLAGILPELDFKPREHVHYQEAVLRVADSLAKNKALPKAAGGSGVLLPS